MEAQERHQTTPADLGVRSQLLVEKHASYIKRVADVRSTTVPCCAPACCRLSRHCRPCDAVQRQFGVTCDRALPTEWSVLGPDSPLLDGTSRHHGWRCHCGLGMHLHSPSSLHFCCLCLHAVLDCVCLTLCTEMCTGIDAQPSSQHTLPI